MNDVQPGAISLLKNWFEKAEKWQKDLFCRLWHGDDNMDRLISRAFSLAKAEYLGETGKFAPSVDFPTEIKLSSSEGCPVILKSISEVHDVGALAPTKPLEFGNNLTIVYGENGCGKSSYVRILKSAVSPKNSVEILGNIYKEGEAKPRATLTYSDDGSERNIPWRPNLDSNCPLNIYDSSVAKRFVEEKNEVVYEPQALSMLSAMAKVYEGVKEKIEDLKKENSALMTKPDEAISAQKSVSAFLNLNSLKQFDNFISEIIWTEKEQTELSMLREDLKEQDPVQKIRELKSQKTFIEKQFEALTALIAKTGNSASEKYLTLRQAQIDAKNEADRTIDGLKSVSLLNRTGSDKWKTMWSNAVNYVKDAGIESADSIVVDGKCALCQQNLSEDALKRIEEFAKYASSSAIKKAEKALENFKQSTDELQKVQGKINIENIENTLRAINLPDDLINFIISLYKTAASRCKWLLEYTSDVKTEIPKFVELKALQEVKDRYISAYDSRIESLKNLIENREEHIKRVNDLLTAKWINENKDVRRNDIMINNSISSCKTNAVTSLKKDLTKLLITDTYIRRFNEEMRLMNADKKIRVELVPEAEKGKAYHKIVLKGAVKKRKTGEILSEGEFRVVSLAAFLADLSSWDKVLPFIFDDPINSLDHRYEKRVAKRLVRLSDERQVIVFTHRLAFSELLKSCVDDYNNEQHAELKLKLVELRNSPLGEPSELQYIGSASIDKALGKLSDKIPRLKKLQKEGSYDEYDNGIKSLCSDLRKAVEHGIETDLLNNIVMRFRPSVQSHRLRYLKIVTNDDVALFDRMMTKYSEYEHSQSLERPVSLPELSNIENDIDCLKKWYKDFKKRRDDFEKNKA